LPLHATTVVLLRHAPQVLEHHRDLRGRVDRRRHVEMVAGRDDDVEVARDVEHPVELPQRVVEVGDEQQAHRRGSYARAGPGDPVEPADSRDDRENGDDPPVGWAGGSSVSPRAPGGWGPGSGSALTSDVGPDT
jgi:hypothetical protein